MPGAGKLKGPTCKLQGTSAVSALASINRALLNEGSIGLLSALNMIHSRMAGRRREAPPTAPHMDAGVPRDARPRNLPFNLCLRAARVARRPHEIHRIERKEVLWVTRGVARLRRGAPIAPYGGLGKGDIADDEVRGGG